MKMNWSKKGGKIFSYDSGGAMNYPRLYWIIRCNDYLFTDTEVSPVAAFKATITSYYADS